MSQDLESAIRENERLTRELRDVEARLSAIQASRWWRLNPRAAVKNLRSNDRADAELAARGGHAFPLDFDEPDVEIYRRVEPYTMTTPTRIYALVRAVEYVVQRGVPGAVVECGVWRGGSMMAAALTLLRLGAERDLYLFDTFSGMTPPTDMDVKRSGERATDLLETQDPESDIWAIAGLDDVREAVLGVGYPEERIHFVEGPVEETLPANAPDEISLLRLDTDWYASTKHELVHLYPRLATGGVLILDDYGYWQGVRRAVDEYFDEQDLQLLLHRVDNSGRVAVKF